MKSIYVGKGKFAIVDDDDFLYLSEFTWHHDLSGYVRRHKPMINGKRSGWILMHRQIMKEPIGKFVDHINHDPFDNRKANLRVATNSENQMNRKKKGKGVTTSIHKGVMFTRNKWVAYITIGKKTKNIGRFDREDDAALAYNKEALKLYGEFACLNEVL